MILAAVVVKLEGIEDLVRNFNLGARDARNFARGATHKVAGVLRTSMRRRVKKRSGLLRKKIKTKRRRERDGMFRSDVIIPVGAIGDEEAGPYYWFFLEFGTHDTPAQPFARPAVQEVRPKANRIYRDDVRRRAIKKMEQRARK